MLPEGPEPSLAHLMDLIMMMILGGRERTRAEHEALLGPEGYTLVRDTPLTAVLPWRLLEFQHRVTYHSLTPRAALAHAAAGASYGQLRQTRIRARTLVLHGTADTAAEVTAFLRPSQAEASRCWPCRSQARSSPGPPLVTSSGSAPGRMGRWYSSSA